MDTNAAHAFARFGLGRRGNETPPADPAAWLRMQLDGPDPARLAQPPTAASGLAALREDRRNRTPARDSQGRALYRRDAQAQLGLALTTPTPFRQRLVWFWSNHFTVSLRRFQCAALAGPFVEEAIRPHVTGRFEDMLLAVMRHPAMLLYLDNTGSVGPGSPVGQRTRRGLNENLARECLELHTVTPVAGYTQADVTGFARILTGWSIDGSADPPGFRYRAAAHEPGEHLLMGRRFPPDEAGGIAALRFLAAQPATHQALARKLVRHFVADEPPEDAVRAIAGTLRDTGGDLGAASAALVDLPAAWQPQSKLRTPLDFVVAVQRAVAAPAPQDGQPDLVTILGVLGQPIWAAPQPDGWPDAAAHWASPEAVMRRIDWAYGAAGRLGAVDALELAENNLGPLLQPATREAIGRAGSRRDALTLFLTSPEFQRR